MIDQMLQRKISSGICIEAHGNIHMYDMGHTEFSGLVRKSNSVYNTEF